MVFIKLLKCCNSIYSQLVYKGIKWCMLLGYDVLTYVFMCNVEIN